MSLIDSDVSATSPDAQTVRIERTFPGPIDKVWSYLVDSDKRATWLAAGEMEPREGATFTLTWNNSKFSPDQPMSERARASDGHSMTGRVVQAEPPRLLVFTWGHKDYDSQVTFALSEEGARVRLVLTHALLRDTGTKLAVTGGWHAHTDILEDVLENRTPRPFWPNLERLEARYKAAS